MADPIATDRLPAHPLVVGLAASTNGPVDASRTALMGTVVEDSLRIAAANVVAAAALAELAAAKEARKKAPDRATIAAADQDKQTASDKLDAAVAEAAAKRENDTLKLFVVHDDLTNLKPPAVDPPTYEKLDRFHESPAGPQFKIVAGYLGGCIEDGGQPATQVLFTDSSLSSWLLVPVAGIELFNRVKDDTAAFGLRDLLWLKTDVRLVQGDNTESVPRTYLNGPFIRADDLGSPADGGTMSRASGLICEAVTPGCCTSRTQRR